MYGCETWATTKYLLSRLDAFDTWALRKILRIPYTHHMSNAEVRGTTGCLPLSHLLTNRRLRLFGHIARSSPRKDHHRALAAAIQQVPPEDLATLGFVQLRHTLAIWTLASRLPGDRPLLKMNGDILWTQQHSSRVRSERKEEALAYQVAEVNSATSLLFTHTSSMLQTDRQTERKWSQ